MFKYGKVYYIKTLFIEKNMIYSFLQKKMFNIIMLFIIIAYLTIRHK